MPRRSWIGFFITRLPLTSRERVTGSNKSSRPASFNGRNRKTEHRQGGQIRRSQGMLFQRSLTFVERVPMVACDLTDFGDVSGLLGEFEQRQHSSGNLGRGGHSGSSGVIVGRRLQSSTGWPPLSSTSKKTVTLSENNKTKTGLMSFLLIYCYMRGKDLIGE